MKFLKSLLLDGKNYIKLQVEDNKDNKRWKTTENSGLDLSN